MLISISLSKANPEWWTKLSAQEQQEYLTKHPGSRLKQTQHVKEQKKTKGLGEGRSLADYAKDHDDPNITQDKILAKLDPDDAKEILEKVKEVESEPTSDKLFSVNKDGTGGYTKERKELHAKIISEVLSKEQIKRATPKGKPTFIVLGGRGGSGKSSFTHDEEKGKAVVQEFDSREFLVMDADHIKSLLKPPYAGHNAFTVHEESSYLFDKIMDAASAMGLNIISDATLKSNKMGPQLKAMQEKGYDIEGHYMFLPRQEAAKRACGRYLSKGKGKRGRLVPPDVILGNTDNEKNFDTLKPFFKRWTAYDNNRPKGEGPALIDRGGK